jgi:peptidoglycan-N-acetylglucosamine deacetylase
MRYRTVLVVAAACGLLLPAVPAQAAPEPCAAGFVRLTFDDGPDRTATPDILDTLAAHEVTATFFVVGQMVVANPALVQRASQEGHTIGNHSWDHPDLTTLSQSQVRSELQDTTDVIEQVTGTTPTQWRPPYGATNPAVEAVAAGVGLTSTVLWTVDPRDWADPPATTVRDRVLQAVRPDSIVLLHDGTGANTPEALPMILTGLGDMGYCVR